MALRTYCTSYLVQIFATDVDAVVHPIMTHANARARQSYKHKPSSDRNELYETYIAAIFLILQSSGFLQPVQNMLQFYAVK